ncbi:hypothetical protein [Desulfitobacterium metallireducens]|uniref:Uncharacterized protein n=1 Tax=Desulfitobacterium metallireducens DSM 15288 TaxID=871968 RepID=W0ECM0_9FIRM|nr:hypothetical protein [Desulfitobacterium metallireducens]AHF08512.1 hypothetical protein DESME_05820 [Desulfitobacterium metallireducens DSM 15288]
MWQARLRAEKESITDVQEENIEPNKNDKVILSELQAREYISTFLWLGLLFGLTILLKVPLDSSAEATAVGISKAPWVFGSIQWLLQRFPVWLSGWVLPVLSGIVLLSLPWWAQKIGKMWTWIVFLVLSLTWVGLTFLYWFMD